MHQIRKSVRTFLLICLNELVSKTLVDHLVMKANKISVCTLRDFEYIYRVYS